MMTSRSYVITTKVSGTQKTQIWDSSHPLPLGHPFRWIMERTTRGVRVRNLGGTDGTVRKDGFREIPDEAIEKGAEFDLHSGQSGKIQLRIRPVYRVAPAYAARQGGTLTVFACAGNWVIESQVLSVSNALFTGKVSRNPVFTLERGGDSYTLTARDSDLVIRSGEKSRTLASGSAVQLETAELSNSILEIGTHSWRFGMTTHPSMPAPSVKDADTDSDAFQKTLRIAAVAFGAVIVTSFLWPKPKPSEELVPAQVAKIIMTAPKKSAAGSPAAGQQKQTPTKEVAANAPKKVQQTAVVQAFRAQALSNAVSGLLKGGMTKLMAQSDFAQGSVNAEAKRMFDTKATALRATGPDTGLMNARNVKVASAGGSGVGGGAGYGKGEHAGVKGQGGAFVSMDAGGASVEEGLTKDEVGEVIHRHLSEVRYCYESAMLRTPDIEGKLITNFTIGGNGMIKSTEVKQSTLPDPRLDDCILRRLATWKFPTPRGGVDVAVTYPFIFKTLGR